MVMYINISFSSIVWFTIWLYIYMQSMYIIVYTPITGTALPSMMPESNQDDLWEEEDVEVCVSHGHLRICSLQLPSGKHTHNYGKSPFLMDKSTISMAIFNSYFDITRGYWTYNDFQTMVGWPSHIPCDDHATHIIPFYSTLSRPKHLPVAEELSKAV